MVRLGRKEIDVAKKLERSTQLNRRRGGAIKNGREKRTERLFAENSIPAA